MSAVGDTDPGPLLDRARTLLRLGRNRMAERELRGVLARDPGHVLGHALLAFALAAQGRHDEALAAARETTRLAPDHWHAHYTVARVLQHAGRSAEAVSAAQAALAADPDRPEVWELLAHAHLSLGQWWHAEQAARQGLARDPYRSALHRHLALALTALRDKERALAAAADAIRADPEDPQAHLAHGQTALAFADHRTAVRAFRAALRLDPAHEQARELLRTAFRRGNPGHRGLMRLLAVARSDRWPLTLPPLAPPIALLAALAAVVHWALWTGHTLAALRPDRGRAVPPPDRGERRVTALACAALGCGAVLLAVGGALAHPAVGGAGLATLALVAPVQEAHHSGAEPVRRLLYGCSAALAATVAGALALCAVLPAAFVTTVTVLAAGAALGTGWLAGGARRLRRWGRRSALVRRLVHAVRPSHR